MNRITMAIGIIIASALAGCETDGASSNILGDYGDYTFCTHYTVSFSDTDDVVVTDSTATCEDGDDPFMYYSQWVSTEAGCPMVLSAIKGGFSGIRRTFGCWKESGVAFRKVVGR
jgi:hypothetical protein